MLHLPLQRWCVLALGAAIVLPLLGTAVLVIAGLRDHLGKADIAVVLGSKVELDGKPSARWRARLDRTLELYRAGYFPDIIASRGVGKEGFDEAAVMRDYLVAYGVPAEHVATDSAGNTTFASAENTLRIMRQRHLSSVFVVSQYFHLPRSRLALRRFGIANVYSAHARYFELRDLYSAPRELAGWLQYRFRPYRTDQAPDAK